MKSGEAEGASPIRASLDCTCSTSPSPPTITNRQHTHAPHITSPSPRNDAQPDGPALLTADANAVMVHSISSGPRLQP